MTGQNVVLGLGIRATSLLLLVATPVVAARLLPPSGVAQIMITLSVGTMIGVVSPVGLPWSLAILGAKVRASNMDHSELSIALRDAIAYLLAIFALLALAVLSPLGASIENVMAGSSRSMVYAAVVIGFGRAASRVLAEVDKAFGGVSRAAIGADLVGPASGLVLIGVVIATGRAVTSNLVTWLLAAGWVLAAAFALAVVPAKPSVSLTARSRRLWERRLAVLAAVAVFNVGIQQIHVVLSGVFLDLNEAANFAIAARLATLTGAPLMVVAGLASPDIGLALQTRSPQHIRLAEARVQRLTGGFAIAASLLFGLYFGFGNTLLRVVFGPGYESGHMELVLLSIGPLGSLFAGAAGLTLVLAGERQRLLHDTVLGAAVAVAAMLIGSQWGSSGLALGYSIGQLVINGLLLRSCRTVTELDPSARPLVAVQWLASKLLPTRSVGDS